MLDLAGRPVRPAAFPENGRTACIVHAAAPLSALVLGERPVSGRGRPRVLDEIISMHAPCKRVFADAVAPGTTSRHCPDEQ